MQRTMKSRCSKYDSDAKRLMGMSGIQVYECRTRDDHYFDIVWRDKRRWSVPYPWEANKHVLVNIGLNLRYRVDAEEQFEKMLTATQRIEEEQKKDNAADEEVMVKDVCRTVIDKPLYFY